MDNMMSYAKNTSLTMLSVLVLLVGGGAIAVILEAATWEELGDWTLKAVLVAAVLVVVSAAVGALGSARRSSK